MTTDDYVVGHVREALAHEGESDIQASVVAGRLVLTGNVATPDRREAMGALAAQTAGGLEVVNELTVLTSPPPGPPEDLT